MRVLKRTLLYRFRNIFLFFGSRIQAERLYGDFMMQVKNLTKKSPSFVLKEALVNVRPAFELRPKKIAASKYYIPCLLTDERSDSFAIRTIFKNARARREKNLSQKLAHEVVDAFLLSGQSYKQLAQLNEEVSKNRPFVRFLKKR